MTHDLIFFNEKTFLVYHLQAMQLIKYKQLSKCFKNLFKKVPPHSPLG